MTSRRSFLAWTGAAAAEAALLAYGMRSRPGAAAADVGTTTAGVGRYDSRSPQVLAASARTKLAPFTVAMPIPQVLRPTRTSHHTDHYDIDIREADVELVPGLTTSAYTYNGQFPGPTIRARTGRPVSVRYHNKLQTDANVHLHGGHTPADSDGHPMALIAPGAYRDYTYPNKQQGTALWYHDHSHGNEAEHVYRGLHGFYLIEDDHERRLGLPSGKYDVPIMLRNIALDDTGAMVLGDPNDRPIVLANGKQQPHFSVAARKYRFRLLNASNLAVFTLTLPGGQLIQVGSDGGLLPAPVRRSQLTISSGERVDLVIDFSRFPVGTQLFLTEATAGAILRFDVGRATHDNSRLPARLRALPPLATATVHRDVTLSFDLVSEVPAALVNGKSYDPDRVDFTVKRGATEIWQVTNGDGQYGIHHNFHMHLVQFRVLDRNGQPPTADDRGLKDTVPIAPGESVRLQAHFTEYLGEYVYHCHVLEHSSFGMMATMNIVK
ncbi:MAG: multicopper oxidase domain-containing protein [Jatrophihabitantaceae bacterium]